MQRCYHLLQIVIYSTYFQLFSQAEYTDRVHVNVPSGATVATLFLYFVICHVALANMYAYNLLSRVLQIFLTQMLRCGKFLPVIPFAFKLSLSSHKASASADNPCTLTNSFAAISRVLRSSLSAVLSPRKIVLFSIAKFIMTLEKY